MTRRVHLGDISEDVALLLSVSKGNFRKVVKKPSQDIPVVSCYKTVSSPAIFSWIPTLLVSYLLPTTAVEVQTRHLRTILSFRGQEVEVPLMQPFRRVPSFWPWILKRIAKNSRRGPPPIASFVVHFPKSPPTVLLLAVPRSLYQNAQAAFHTPFALHSYHWIVNRQQRLPSVWPSRMLPFHTSSSAIPTRADCFDDPNDVNIKSG